MSGEEDLSEIERECLAHAIEEKAATVRAGKLPKGMRYTRRSARAEWSLGEIDVTIPRRPPCLTPRVAPLRRLIGTPAWTVGYCMGVLLAAGLFAFGARPSALVIGACLALAVIAIARLTTR